MARAIALQVAVGLLLVSIAPIVQGASVEGFLEVAVPVGLEGRAQALLQDPTLLIQNAALATPDAPIVLEASHAKITRHVKDVQVLGAPGLPELSPPGPPSTSDPVVDDDHVFLEISALTPDADVLLAPHDEEPLFAGIGLDGGSAGLAVAVGGITVVDGYRKTLGERRNPGTDAFYYDYQRAGPLAVGAGFEEIALDGGARGYIWGAYVVVRNATSVKATFQTGLQTQSSTGGLERTEHYEYLTFELEGLRAVLQPGALSAQVFVQAMSIDLDGIARLPAAYGTLTAGPDFYRAAGEQELVLQGNLTLALTPLGAPERASGSAPALATVHVTGELDAASMAPLVRAPGRSTTTLVAVGAGGATVLGVAAWYLLAANGVVVAVPRGRRTHAATRVQVGNPGELLFDTDRFTLYHLVRRHAGLSAAEATALTGIEDASGQLEVLAEGGLVVPMAEEPRRYAFPGAVSERRADRIRYLRDPATLRVARLLTLHGLTPEALLEERAAKARDPVRARQVRTMVPRLIELRLVRRERGEDGQVLDPTEELFACLRLMGEYA